MWRVFDQPIGTFACLLHILFAYNNKRLLRADPCCRSVIEELAHAFSCAYIELWMYLGSLESTQKLRVATLTHFSCSPNFPRASITRYTHAKHEKILNSRLNVYLPPGISQMKALLSFQNMLLKRLPFLEISARRLLFSVKESRHFQIFSRAPLSQVQFWAIFLKPICHALVFQEERFWISWLINCHSSSDSIETR